MEFKNNFLESGGVKLHYIEYGEGEPLMLLHGIGGSAEISWGENIEPLSKFFKVYALDMIGHGYSDKPKTDYSLDHAVKILDDFISYKGIEKPNLMGNSMGGLISLAYTSKFPNKIKKLVLVSSGGLGKEVTWMLKISSIPFLGKILAHPTPKKVKKTLEFIMFDERLITGDLVDRFYHYKKLKGANKAFVKSAHHGINLRGQKENIDYFQRLIEIKNPTYIIWGEQDKVIPVSHAYHAYDHIKNQENRKTCLTIFKECGHWPQREKAEEFNEIVIGFFKE